MQNKYTYKSKFMTHNYKSCYKSEEGSFKIALYVISNVITKEFYIGSTSNVRKRFNMHKCLLRSNKHHSPKMQHSWNKHGEKNFTFIVIQFFDDPKIALTLEQHFLDTLHPTYNVCKLATSSAGVPKSPEARAKIAKANRNPEKIKRFREYAKLPKSEEHKLKIGLAHLGKVASEETRAKLRTAAAKRWANRREETRLNNPGTK